MIEDAPVFLYNLAQAYRQLGKYEDAIWHYERFVSRAHPTGKLKEAIDGFLAEMRTALEKKPTEPAPVSSTLTEQPPAGPGVGTSDTPTSTTADVSVGPTDRRQGMSTRRKLAIGVGAGGLAALGAGIFLGVRAKGFESDAEDLCPMMACDRADEANALLERGQTNATYANVALGVGAAAVIGAAVLWFTGSSASSDTAVIPHVSRSFAGLGVTTRF